MKPRDYQKRAIDQAIADLCEIYSALLVLATGLGKTVIFSHIAKHYMQSGRVMVLAHREELIAQAADKIGKITGRIPDIEMGDQWADKPSMYGTELSPVVVSSIQTQCAGMNGAGRMTRFDPRDFSLVIVDEAHYAAAHSYKRVIAHFRQNPQCRVLGVTATPDRKDESALGQVFERVSFVFEISDGIDAGWLAPITQRLIYVDGLDFSACRTTAGDLNGADLAVLLETEKALHGIAHPTYEISAGRKTLVFAASVAQAETLAEILNRHKDGCARFVYGGTDEVTRRRTLRSYRDGGFQFLVNCGVFTEGFDEPGIEVVAVARPTKSRALYCQMVGRGTRPLDGIVDGIESPEARRAAIAASPKRCVEVLDFVGNAGRHKLMTTADILGGKYPDEVLELAEKKARESGAAVDMKKLLERSEEELDRRRQEAENRRIADAATRARVIGLATYSAQVIDAFNAFDLAPAQVRGWDKGRKPSVRQVEALRKFGVDGAEHMNRTHASQLLDSLIGRAKEGKCTWKQMKLLKKHGYDPDCSFADARQIIDRLAANNWRRPGEAAA